MMRQLRVLLISSAMSLAVSGCAVTTYGPTLNTSFTYRGETIQGYVIKDIFPEANTAMSVSTSCVGFPYTGMAFPIIPLPPIVPVWFLAPDPSVKIQIDTTRAEDVGCYLTVKRGIQEYTVFPHRKDVEKFHTYLDFNLRGACLDIDGTEIRVHGIQVGGRPTISEPIRININPRNEFSFGYLKGW